MADKIAPGVTRDGPTPVRVSVGPDPEEERLQRLRERLQPLIWIGAAVLLAASWVGPEYFPEWTRAGQITGLSILFLGLVTVASVSRRLWRMERERAEAQGQEVVAEWARAKRDASRWYAVVGVMMLFASGISAALGVGGVLMVFYGIVTYLWWTAKAKKAYDPWKDEELDQWEEEEFGKD